MPLWDIHYREIKLVGSFHFTPDDVKEAYKILIEGQSFFEKLITFKMPLKELDKAFKLLESGRAFKIAIYP